MFSFRSNNYYDDMTSVDTRLNDTMYYSGIPGIIFSLESAKIVFQNSKQSFHLKIPIKLSTFLKTSLKSVVFFNLL